MTGKTGILGICARRIGDDRGSIGVVIALVMFVMMGMLMMTWNTVQVSKAKMRLQNAVDSAALAHATWQARGMNAIQNLNEEKYLALDLAERLLTVAKVVEKSARVAYDTAIAATAFPPAMAALKAVAYAIRIGGLLIGCTSGWITQVVVRIIDVFQMIYCWSPIAGVINAENFATFNGASYLGATQLNITEGASVMFSLASVPITRGYKELFRLPVKKEKPAKAPWKHKDETLKFTGGAFKSLAGVYKFFGTGKAWDVEAYVSEKDKDDNPRLPPPVAWLSIKVGAHVETMPLKVYCGDSYNKLDDMPVFAIAAGQCVTGDIVPHINNKDAPQRPLGFGAGATAKLVPVSEALGDINQTLGDVANTIIYH